MGSRGKQDVSCFPLLPRRVLKQLFTIFFFLIQSPVHGKTAFLKLAFFLSCLRFNSLSSFSSGNFAREGRGGTVAATDSYSPTPCFLNLCWVRKKRKVQRMWHTGVCRRRCPGGQLSPASWLPSGVIECQHLNYDQNLEFVEKDRLFCYVIFLRNQGREQT